MRRGASVDGRERGHAPRQPHVATVALHGPDHLVGHGLLGDVGDDAESLAPPERPLRRAVGLHVVEHGRGDRSDLHHRGAHGQPLEVGPQPGGEVGEARLRRRVGHQAREHPDAGHRRDVHDVAAPAPDHPGDDLPAQVGGREQVQLEEGREGVGVHAGERAGQVDAGVVDQHVDGAGLVLDPLDERPDLVGVGEVGGVGGAAELHGEGAEGVAVPGHEGHVGAAGARGAGDGLSDAPGRPGHQHPCAREVHRRPR
jgi:hypothetical protein